MKNKKAIGKILIFAGCLLLLAGLLLQCCHHDAYRRANMKYKAIERVDFYIQKQSFDLLADVATDFYDEIKKNHPLVLDVRLGECDGCFRVLAYDPSGCVETVDWEITEEERQAYRQVSREIFEGHSVHGTLTIVGREDRVVFYGISGYAVIYMREGNKPMYVCSEDEPLESFFVDRLSLKWYHIGFEFFRLP